MRAVSAGTVLSNKLPWWESLVDASECWGSRITKSLWGSSLGAVKHDAQVQAIPSAVFFADNKETNLRADSNETCTALVLYLRKLLKDACKGFRNTYGSVCGSMHEDPIPSITFSDTFSRDVAGGYKRSLLLAKCISLDAMPANLGRPGNGYSFGDLFEKTHQACEVSSSSLSPDNFPHKAKNPERKTCIAFCPWGYQGLDSDTFQVWKVKAFKAKSKHFTGRACLSGFFKCPQEMIRSRHALPLTLFGRALSTSTEKQFDEDVAEQRSSVPGQQQSSVLSQQQSAVGGQQSSLGGQQSSLEVPDSKPVGGPSWPNPDNAASYVLMSNIYADGDRWDEVKRINEMRLKARAWKKPGKAYVEIQAKVHEFIVGDRTHQDSTNIYEKLRKIKRHMGHIGYVPYVDLVLENRSYYDPYKPR